VETPANRWLRGSEIVLERWCIDLVTPPKVGAPDLPVVYKKAVVLFRRVFSEARLLPVWRLKKRLSKVKLNNSLKLQIRVTNGAENGAGGNGRVAISVPLIEGQTRDKVTEEFSFGQIDTPAGYSAPTVTFHQLFLCWVLIPAHSIFLCYIELMPTFESQTQKPYYPRTFLTSTLSRTPSREALHPPHVPGNSTTSINRKHTALYPRSTPSRNQANLYPHPRSQSSEMHPTWER